MLRRPARGRLPEEEPLAAMAEYGDNRLVVLLKSLETQNRFYTLVEPERGWQNGDLIPAFPDDLPLGIAYPCLEDGLNDFAVIRTTFETVDLFPDDRELRTEMMAIIEDARSHLCLRLRELRDRIASGQAHFLGTDLSEFKEYTINLATRGAIRKQLDNMMKVDVFESVARTEAESDFKAIEPTYHFRLRPNYVWEEAVGRDPRQFIALVFNDLLEAVEDDANYQGKYVFDREVFQKFIGLMFVNYATTDQVFYGTNKADYGVSGDKDMQETPLYRAVAEALRYLEREWRGAPHPTTAPAGPQVASDVPSAEQKLIQPLTAVAEAVQMLRGVDHPRAPEVSAVIARACRQLFAALKDANAISPIAEDPFRRLLDD